MDETRSSGIDSPPVALPPAIRSRPHLTCTPPALALTAARRAALALARREPAPLLALGFGAGLLARAALGALAAGRPGGRPAAPAGSEVVQLRVETISLRVTRSLRRP